mmetsp:Transcript_93939/g.271557  ORF Transcript_93939/g.271557 Transcript_93939/m.271557 type:complete len:465 (-) Transcript_93939:852-2246(-)
MPLEEQVHPVRPGPAVAVRPQLHADLHTLQLRHLAPPLRMEALGQRAVGEEDLRVEAVGAHEAEPLRGVVASDDPERCAARAGRNGGLVGRHVVVAFGARLLLGSVPIGPTVDEVVVGPPLIVTPAGVALWELDPLAPLEAEDVEMLLKLRLPHPREAAAEPSEVAAPALRGEEIRHLVDQARVQRRQRLITVVAASSSPIPATAALVRQQLHPLGAKLPVRHRAHLELHALLHDLLLPLHALDLRRHLRPQEEDVLVELVGREEAIALRAVEPDDGSCEHLAWPEAGARLIHRRRRRHAHVRRWHAHMRRRHAHVMRRHAHVMGRHAHHHHPHHRRWRHMPRWRWRHVPGSDGLNIPRPGLPLLVDEELESHIDAREVVVSVLELFRQSARQEEDVGIIWHRDKAVTLLPVELLDPPHAHPRRQRRRHHGAAMAHRHRRAAGREKRAALRAELTIGHGLHLEL